MRIRIEFAKTGSARFLSHLELVRAFERALRRAAVPLAFSEGFHPHPKLSFASALAVGVSGQREYLDVELKETVDVSQIYKQLCNTVPEGIEIKRLQQVDDKTPSLMAVVNCAQYQVIAALGIEVGQEEVDTLLQVFCKRERIIMERETKRGKKEVDIRPGIYLLEGRVTKKRLTLNMLLALGEPLTVRPQEVLEALVRDTGLPVDPGDARIVRTGLYIRQADKMLSPMEL